MSIVLKHITHPDIFISDLKMSVLELYQHIKDLFCKLEMMKYQFPMDAATKTVFGMINDYYLSNDSFDLLCGGSINQNNITYLGIRVIGPEPDVKECNITVDGVKYSNDTIVNIKSKSVYVIRKGFRYDLKKNGIISDNCTGIILCPPAYTFYFNIKEVRLKKLEKLKRNEN